MDDESLYERNKRYAKETLGLREWLYYSSGSDNERTLNANEKAFDNLALVPKVLPDHWRIQGGRQGRAPPPGGPNSFIFMQFSAKIINKHTHFGSWRPPWGKS